MKYISIVIIGVFFCSTPEHHDDSNIMEQLCLDYISYLENSEFKNKQILIHLREEESEDKRYRAFRVAAGPAYLPPGLIPNRFDRISDFLVLFSLNEEVDPNQKENIERTLAKMQVYSEKAYRITSNYPEWVILLDRHKRSPHLIKDAWYRPLNKLINLMDE